MSEPLQIPDDCACAVASKLNKSLGFACDRADQEFKLKNGSTALFWHLVAVVASHVEEDG